MCAKIYLNIKSFGKVIGKTKWCKFLGHTVVACNIPSLLQINTTNHMRPWKLRALGLVAFCDIQTSGQEAEWVYFYNPGAHTGGLSNTSVVLCL